MTEALLKLAPQRLRVAVLAADPRRGLQLSRLVRDLGHEVVPGVERAAAILADGVAVRGDLPAVSLGPKAKTIAPGCRATLLPNRSTPLCAPSPQD
jgi:hypothetical protein